jgi:hypothetical protein
MLDAMIKDAIKKIGASENPALKFAARLMRMPILAAQWQLLRFQKKKEIVELIRAIRKTGGFLMWPTEIAQLYTAVVAALKVEGDLAEVGVYRGRSARLLCELKGERTLHLFDTFGGLPKTNTKDDFAMLENMYAADLKSVQEYLKAYKAVEYYPGLFPDTSAPVRDRRFAFVNLDVDLYSGTFEGLKFFYPRMTTGGIILVHDYSTLVGVTKAVDEFFADKPESVLELSTSQCMVVKA